MIMAGEGKKTFILALLSTLLSMVLLVVVFEGVLKFKHERWKSRVVKNGEFPVGFTGGITTVSTNPILMWEYRPNAESNDPSFPKIRTNRYGFRDYDYGSMAKPADFFRISFIGDSVTLGLKVDSQSTFVSKFATYAIEEHPNFKTQSMNHGIDGYNTIQIFELLTSRVLQFKPDKVVYVMSLNDFDFEESSGDKIKYFKAPNSFILKKLEKIYRRILRIDFHIWNFEKNKREVFKKIIEMKKLLHTRDIDFQIVLLPIFQFENSDKDFTAYPLSEMHFAIRQFLTNEQIEFIDLLESFRNQEKSPNYFAHDIWHPNEDGHDFIAKRLVQFLMRGT